MRIFVFRPQSDAERTARAITARGHDAILAPLFTIVPLDTPAPEGPFDAIVLTSGNGVSALALAPQAWRDLPIFSVGARTAQRARDAGFGDARSAGGDRNDLLALITSNLKPPARLLLIVGRDRHEDVPENLKHAGFDVTIWTSYAAEAVSDLPAEAASALREGQADAALHYSARGAQTFMALARKAGLESAAAALTHVAISAEVAAPLIASEAETVLVAEYPEEAGLFAALDQVSDRHGSGEAAAKEAVASAGAAADKGAMKDKPSSRSHSRRTPPTLQGKAMAMPEEAAMAEPAAPPARSDDAVTPPHAVETNAPATADAAPAIATGGDAPSPEAVLPTEALPAEFDPPDAAPNAAASAPSNLSQPPAERAGVPWAALAATGLVGGLIGAGLMMLVSSRFTPDRSNELASLQSRLEALQSSTTAADRKASAAAEAAQKAAGESQANAQRLAELASTQRSQAPNQQVIDGLGEQARQAQATAAAVEQRLNQTAARIGSVETLAKSAAAPSPQAMAAARIVLAERVRSAIAAGRPFAADVTALAAGGGAQEQIAALSAVAESGAPTRDALAAELAGHRTMISRELTPASASWQDKLLGIASRIVTVRPVGDTGANDRGTLLIRLENAIAGGNFTTAATLWDQLPEPARRASATLGDRLKKRAAADAAISKMAQDAVAALGAAG